MKILQQAKNGVMVSGLKSYEELDEAELSVLRFQSGTSKDDYTDYQVRYNKKGELLGVSANEFTEDKKVKVDEGGKEAQAYFDGFNILYGSGKERTDAVKRHEQNTGRKMDAKKAGIARALKNQPVDREENNQDSEVKSEITSDKITSDKEIKNGGI